jgi:serpin B
MIELPFQRIGEGHPKISLFIVLPKEMKKLEINKNNFEDWEAQLRTHQVQLGMPSFRVDEKPPLDQMLQKLGMKGAFTSKADFSGMTEQEGFYLGLATHRSSLKIDENGSSATVASMLGKKATLDQKEGLQMSVNRPFFFFLFDRASGCLLCLGRITQP